MAAGPRDWMGRACALGAGAAALAAAVLAGPLAGAARGPGADPKAGGRPNFVVIQTDDQTEASLTRRYMPATRRLLVKPGTTFSNYVVTTPACCPSRSSLLTGQYAHNHGVLSNNAAYPALRNPRNVLPAWLARAGYRTGHVGKFLNGYEKEAPQRTTPAPGWDDWETLLAYHYFDYGWSRNGEFVRYGSKRADYLTRTINDTATRLIRGYSKRSRPFYLQVDQFAPHQSPDADPRCPRAAIPDPADRDLFRHESLPHPPSFNEEDVSDKRRFIRNKGKVTGDQLSRARTFHRCRNASLRGVDRGVREIWHTLQKTGEAANTILVFISDNGFFAGEHRLAAGKTLPYRESSEVPLVIRAPRRYVGGSRERRIPQMVGNIDLAPTLLDWANADPCIDAGCRTMDGRSLVPLLEGGSWPADRGIVIEFGRGRYSERHTGTCQYSGVRRRHSTYVRYNQNGRCGPANERELYDLAEDPFELRNRNGEPAYEPLRVDLAASLETLNDCAGIQGRDAPTPGSSGFCE